MLIWEMIAHQRRHLADLLDNLDETQWRTPSLCADWTVREVAGHLITPFAWGTAKFLLHLIIGGFNFDKTMSQAAQQLAQRPTECPGGHVTGARRDPVDPARLGPRSAVD